MTKTPKTKYKITFIDCPEGDKTFYDKLADQLEELFPKGEKCECGKRLKARSKALVFNAYANIYHNEIIGTKFNEK